MTLGVSNDAGLRHTQRGVFLSQLDAHLRPSRPSLVLAYRCYTLGNDGWGLAMIKRLLGLLAACLIAGAAAHAQAVSREEYQKQLDERRVEIDAMDKSADPMAWAAAQTDFGKHLYAFDSLDEAVIAYRSALEVYSKDLTPKEWAETHLLIGLAFQKRASMKGLAGFLIALGGSGDLPDTTMDASDALQSFDVAEEVYTRADYPTDWVRLQFLEALSHSMLVGQPGGDDEATQEHRAAATQRYNNILEFNDEPVDHLLRALAHKGLASLNEHGFVNEGDRIRFALEHAKLAKVEFTTAGEPVEAESMNRMINSLEYDLMYAEDYVPDENDALFGAKYH